MGPMQIIHECELNSEGIFTLETNTYNFDLKTNRKRFNLNTWENIHENG